MYKAQVQNNQDYRTIDPYRGVVEYIEDSIGNRYYIGGATIEDVYSLLEDPEYVNDMITKVPNLINTFVAAGLTNGSESFESEYIMTAMTTPINMEMNLDTLVSSNDNKDFCVKFTTGTGASHISWPLDMMTGVTSGILVQFAVKDPNTNTVNGYTQIIYTSTGYTITRTKVDGTISKWLKNIVSDSDTSISVGHWKLEESTDHSLGFFHNR